MNKEKLDALSFIESKEALIKSVSSSIWEFKELSLKEYKSAALYIEKLKEEGFEVTENLCDIKTGFSAKYGSGRPFIGILAEYDALAGVGHGCGHNMLGAASFGAVLGVKKYLEENKLQGTVIFYGCPGEEGGASKALYARDGVWSDLDAAITWHPGDTFEVVTGTCNSCIQTRYKFHGVASHAAGSPEHGRSALDAVEIMNNGVQYLREHSKDDARIHYAILDTGGISPNVVQAEASVLYMVRSKKVFDAIELQRRVDLVAQGAAIMTETTMENVFVDACSNTVPNTCLEKLMHKNMCEIPLPEYTDEEWSMAKELKAGYTKSDKLPGIGAQTQKEISKFVKEKTESGTRAINDFVMPFYSGEDFEPGSTDVGDVSWNVPTVQMNAVTWPSGTPGHSWQNTKCANSSLGDKGTMYAAKAMCACAIDLFEDPKILLEAKTELKERTEGGYMCPVPEGAKLLVIE